MKIFKNLIIIFIIIAIIIGTFVFISLTSNNEIYDRIEIISISSIDEIRNSHEVVFYIQKIKLNIRDLLIKKNHITSKEKVLLQKSIRETNDKIKERLTAWDKSRTINQSYSEQNKKLFDYLKTKINDYTKQTDNLIVIIDTNKSEYYNSFFNNKIESLFKEIQDTSEVFEEMTLSSLKENVSKIKSKVVIEKYIDIIIIITALLFSLFIGVYISRNVLTPIQRLKLSIIKSGQEMNIDNIEKMSEDEIEILSDVFQKMKYELKNSKKMLTTQKNNFEILVEKRTVDLISTNEYLEKLILSLNCLLIVTSHIGLIKSVNSFASKKLGYEENELINQPISLIIDLSDIYFFEAWIKYIINKETLYNIERNFITKDGTNISFLLTSSIIKHKDGSVNNILFTAQDISDLKRIQYELHKAQRYSQDIIDYCMDMIIAVDKNRQIIEFNKAAQKTFGYSIEEVINRHVQILYSDPEEGMLVYNTLMEKDSFKGEITNKRKNGELFTSFLSVSNIYDNDRNILGIVGISRDITEQRKMEAELEKYRQNLYNLVQIRTIALENEITKRTFAEEQITASLRENEILLKEIHHRVKNNLQIISSLLDSQSELITSEDIKNMFIDSQNRIKSMSLIHEKLYQSKDLSKINFGQYIRDLINNLLSTYGINTSKIQLKIDTEEIYLNIETAIPCGLILNELFSNSLKYAFGIEQKGEIVISFSSGADNKYILIHKDNGVGLPNNFDYRTSKSLGMYLINNLVKRQLKGTLDVDNTTGAAFKIVFSELKYGVRI